MKKLRLLLAFCALLLGWSNASAQGTWTAPEVPGVNPLELQSTDEVYLYNIGADAFVNYGMNWNTQAIATRLQKGDEVVSGRHLLKVAVQTGGTTIKMSMKDKSDKTIFCGNGTTNDIWTDNTYNNVWTPTASAKYTNAYTLKNSAHNENLDVQWLYGGRLTFDGGQGFTDWAFIRASSITDQSYAKYKERKEMYAIYKELYDNDKVSTYSAALATANAVYTNASATKAELRAATRTLLIAVADGIENPIKVNALFTNADIHGNQVSKDWNVELSTSGGNPQMGDYTCELWHATATITQTQTDVPNGLYDVIFHGLYRQDDSKSQAAPHLTVTGTNVMEDDLSLIGSLQPTWAVSNGTGNGGKWVGSGVPDDRVSAGQAQTLGDATAAINNVQVKGNSLTIQLAITGGNQWVLFQGFDIIYNGPINVAVYKRLMAKKAEADAIVDSPMSDDVHTTLVGCIEVAEGLTANSDEGDLNTAYDNLVSAISDAETSIAFTAHVNAIVNNKGDITSLINGDFETNADGWTGGNRITGLARSWKSGSDKNAFYERTTEGPLSYTLHNMPAGTYKVVAAARGYDGGKITPEIAGTTGATLNTVGDARSAKSGSEINLNGVEMPYSDLGGFTTNASGHNWKWITATGTLAEDGDLVINFNCEGNSWMPIDDVHLYCTNYNETSYTRTVGDGKGTINTSNFVVTADIILENPNTILRSTGKVPTAAGDMNNNQYNSSRITKLVLYDGYDFTNSGDNYGLDYGAILYRNIPANTWCTLMVPFYPTNLDVKKVPSSIDGEGVLTFVDAPSKDMNDSPMLVKSTEGVTSITGLRNSTYGINKGSGTYGSGVPMTGVYTAGNVPASDSDNIYYALGTDNNLHKVTGSQVTIAPFRAYFTLNTSGGSEARSALRMNFGDVTGVANVEVATETTVKDGKYIENGKIVIVKNGIKYNTAGQQVK